MSRQPRWVIAVIAICTLVELGQIVAGAVWMPAARRVVDLFGAFWPMLLDPGNRPLFPGQSGTMFVTYGLLHGGVAHLAMNMLSLAGMAPTLARLIGSRRMAAVYGITQVAAAAAYWLMAPQGGPMVGASGAIFGLAGALVGHSAAIMRARGLPLGPLLRSAAILLALNIALTLAVPAIAWEAHLGGALAGLILGLFMEHLPRRRGRTAPPT